MSAFRGHGGGNGVVVDEQQNQRLPAILFSSCDSLDDGATHDEDDDGGGDSVSPLRRASSVSYPPNYFYRFMEIPVDATSNGDSTTDHDHESRSSKSGKGSKSSASSWTSHLPVAFGAHQVIAPTATASRTSKIPSRSQSAVNEAAK